MQTEEAHAILCFLQQADGINEQYNKSMSKDSIQDAVHKNLEKYFRDLGEQPASNIYDMVVHAVEKPMLEMVMSRAPATSHRQQICWALTAIPCAKNCSSTVCYKADAA
jgi:Fis family transcriptional regulator